MQGARDGLAQGPDHQAPDEAGVAEADFRLRGMDVDVNEARVAIKEKCQDREAVAHEVVGIGGRNRAHQQLVAHRPAADEQELAFPVGAVEGRQADEALEADTFPLGIDRQGVGGELVADDLGEARQAALRAGGARQVIEPRQVISAQREPDFRVGHGEPPDDLRHGLRFRPVGFQEFQASRRRGEKVANLDGGTGLAAGRGDGGPGAHVNRDPRARGHLLP